MKKLLRFVDENILKIGIIVLIAFIALYPKLPSVHVIRTWVYIRLEDFAILGVTVIWFIQALRRKVKIPWKLGSPIALYWFAGLISFIFSLIFVAPTLVNFFPHVAALSYIRRIEYMILFFVAFSSVRSKKDIKLYFWIVCITVLLFMLYGFGQRLYPTIWHLFPKFFEKYSFCFPSFQTGNEQFAKGIPLCLPPDARITSTFGGHYDLAAYLVVVLSVFVGVLVSLKKWSLRILLFLLYLGSLALLMLTASRVSFIAYVVGATFTLFFYKKKKFIIPMLVISVIMLFAFSGSTAKRFLSTFRFANIVTNSQGQLIGEDTSSLPDSLRRKIASNELVTQNINPQDLQRGSGYIGLPQSGAQQATGVAVIKKTISPEEARRLRLAESDLEISTVSGSFLVKRVLVYDISFTTRFQAEWPNAWKAFLLDPAFGSGYSTITLATDNDYLRALGESGAFGLATFALIFVVFGIALSHTARDVDDKFTKGILFGLVGAAIGLFANATLIDVFESSKVAETFWILLGLGMGTLFLYKKQTIEYKKTLLKIFASPFFLVCYLFIILLAFFGQSIGNYFVADDFTWLKWAATSTTSSIGGYFTNAQHFFYRPLDKTLVFFLYSLFSFEPFGYHLVILFLHFLIGLGVYLFVRQIWHRKWLAFTAALLFIVLPAHGENLLWFSTLSTVLATLFILYSLITYLMFQKSRNILWYIVTFILVLMAFASYEIAVIAPFLLMALDFFLVSRKKPLKTLLLGLPFLVLIPLYGAVRVLTHAFISGGDYSYNLVKLVPNTIGNFLGYLMLFLFGEPAISWYTGLRDILRVSWLPVTGAILVVLVITLVIVWRKRHAVHMFVQSKYGNIMAFGLVFSIISLLPFLGLGNIAPRYLYLASIGMILFVLAGGMVVYEKIALPVTAKKIGVVCLLIILSGIYYFQVTATSHEWQHAGNITNHTLRIFRVDFENLSASDHVYFVNTPVRYKNTWVFPLGVQDGLWFIYRQKLPQIQEAESVEAADAEAAVYAPQSVYIFRFDREGVIHRVK